MTRFAGSTNFFEKRGFVMRMMHIIETCAPKLKPKPSAQQTSEAVHVTAPVVRQAPPPPGMGKLVDKTA